MYLKTETFSNLLILKKNNIMVQLGMIGIWQLLLIVIFFMTLLLMILALIDILKSEFTGNNKIIWVILVLFTGFFGALLYFFIGRKQKIKEDF